MPFRFTFSYARNADDDGRRLCRNFVVPAVGFDFKEWLAVLDYAPLIASSDGNKKDMGKCSL